MRPLLAFLVYVLLGLCAWAGMFYAGANLLATHEIAGVLLLVGSFVAGCRIVLLGVRKANRIDSSHDSRGSLFTIRVSLD